MKLRPYQENVVNGARNAFRVGRRSVVLVVPTGGGKSAIIGAITQGLVTNNKRVLIMAHRTRLIMQLKETLTKFGIQVSHITGTRKTRLLCMLGMVETVRRRMDKLPEPDYIIVDETHHVLSSQYLSVVNKYPNAKIIGVTATPSRTDGKGLGEVFEEMVLGPAMKWLIDEGFLAQYRYFMVPSHIDLDQIKRDAKTGDYNEKDAASAVRKSHIVGDAIGHYKQYVDGKTGIVFCTGIDHAKEVAQEFNDAGIPSAAIDGTMDDKEQDRLMRSLAAGSIKLLMSADLIGEGVDVPSINCVFMLRPTESVVIFLQQAGRVLRLKEDGSYAYIFDHVQNAKRHGLPCDPRTWTLEMPKKKENEIKTVQCQKCQRVFNAFTAKNDAALSCADSVCPIKNGISRPVQERVVEVIDENLVEVNNPWEWAGGIDPILARGPEWEALLAKADTEEKLKQICRARGYNKGWWIRQAEMKGLRKPVRQFWRK